ARPTEAPPAWRTSRGSPAAARSPVSPATTWQENPPSSRPPPAVPSPASAPTGPGHPGELQLAAGGTRAGYRHGVPGPGGRPADAGVAELLPRQRGTQGSADGHRLHEEDLQAGTARHGHRPARRRPADRDPVRWRA